MEGLFILLGIFFGLFLLFSPILVFNLFKKLNKVSSRVDELETQLAKLVGIDTSTRVEPANEPKAEAPPLSSPTPAEEQPSKPESTTVEKEMVAPRAETYIEPPIETPSGKGTWGPDESSTELSPISDLDQKIKAWLFGGNTVARVGGIVLFFGVAFLLKFAVDSGWLPIEVRLMGTALGGFILIGLGWRLRNKRLNYALILQGIGVGIIYLTVFAAVNMYQFISTTPGLIWMVILVILTSALAILQNARSLAFLSAVGGFLAPVLISTDTGNHVALFSYYVALDIGILILAWFKAWRDLNLLGFVFTFVIGTLWGYQFYQPEHYYSVQPFLIIFFLLFVAIPVFYAHRQPTNLKGLIDGSLLFGVPLVGFGLQSRIVADFEYGLAFSALALGLFYVLLGTYLWKRVHKDFRLLIEVFLSLAVAFGTLAIPFAVDGHWTGAAWALEGAALVWLGVRQHRWLSRVFGVLIQLAAGVAYLGETSTIAAELPIFNFYYLSALMISVAGLFTAFQLFGYKQQREPSSRTSAGMLAWGLLWWFGAGGNEIWSHVENVYRINALLVFAAFSILGLTYIRRRWDWSDLAHVTPLLLPAMLWTAFVSWTTILVAHPFAHWGILSWSLAFAIQYRTLWKFESEWAEKIIEISHLGTFWLLVFILTWEGSWLVAQAVPETDTWHYVIWGLVPMMFVAMAPAAGRKLTWPVQRFKASYLETGLLPLAGFSALWTVSACMLSGDPSPVGYIPVINPLELTQLFILTVSFLWLKNTHFELEDKFKWYAWYGLAFLVLNGIIARSVHFFGDVAFTFSSLWDSPRYQTSVSIIWTLTALLIMVLATRFIQRTTWLIGSTILAAVVLKMFLVDLADIGTVARIISFIVVGLLILIIGYLSPMPPREAEQ